jgi:hypothetical protein
MPSTSGWVMKSRQSNGGARRQGGGEPAIADLVVFVRLAFAHVFGVFATEIIKQFANALPVEHILHDEETVTVELPQKGCKLLGFDFGLRRHARP